MIGRLLPSAALFVLIFVAGFILMGFEMLGSRYLNPYFGGGITTWACLISVVLFAMMIGYTLGGVVADRCRELWILSSVLLFVGAYLIAVALLAHEIMESLMVTVGYGFWGTILAASSLTFVPVMLLAALSPFFVRLLLKELRHGGRITGAVYGVSTMGNVIGTLVTVFVFIPTVGTKSITIVLGSILIGCSIACQGIHMIASRRAKELAALLVGVCFMLPGPSSSGSYLQRAPALYPEGPLWLDGELYVAEMTADRVSTLSADGLKPFWHRRGCGPTSVAKFTSELLAVSCHHSGRVIFLNRAGSAVAELSSISGRVLRSPNNIHATGRGQLFVSDPGLFEQSKRNRGSVYYYADDGTQALVAENLRYPNGVAFDSEKSRLYVAEHLAQQVLSFTLDKDKGVLNQTIVLDSHRLFPGGFSEALAGPDGIQLSPAGTLFVALYGSGRVMEWHFDGTARWLRVPFKFVTSVALSDDAIAIAGVYDNRRYPYRGEIVVFGIE